MMPCVFPGAVASRMKASSVSSDSVLGASSGTTLRSSICAVQRNQNQQLVREQDGKKERTFISTSPISSVI